MGKAGRAGLTFALLLADFGLCSQHGLAARGKLELVQRSGVTKATKGRSTATTTTTTTTTTGTTPTSPPPFSTTTPPHTAKCPCGDIWQYDGCFHDVGSATGETSTNATIRRLAHLLRVIPDVRLGTVPIWTPDNSRETCYDACTEAGYGPGLVGLESGNMCWCANVEYLYDLPDDSALHWDGHVGVNRTSDAFWDDRRAADTMCNVTCPGDPGTTCGGDWHVALYNHIDCQFCPGASSSTTTTTSMVATPSEAPFLTTATPINPWPYTPHGKKGMLSLTNLGIAVGVVVLVAVIMGVEGRSTSGVKRRRGVPKPRIFDGNGGTNAASESSEDLTDPESCGPGGSPANDPSFVCEAAPPSKRGRAAVYEGDVVPFEAAALGTVRRVSPLVPGNVTAGGEPRGAHRAAVRGDAHRAGLLAGVGPLVLGVADGKEVAMGPDTPGDTDDGSTSASASTPQTDHSSGSTEVSEVSEGSEGDVADGHGVEMGYSDGGTSSAAASTASTPPDQNADVITTEADSCDTALYGRADRGFPGFHGLSNFPGASDFADDAGSSIDLENTTPTIFGLPPVLAPSTSGGVGFKLLLPPTPAMDAYPVAATPVPSFVHYSPVDGDGKLKTSKSKISSKISFEKYEIAPDIKPVIKAQRFVTQNQSEWRKSLHGAVKSAFAKLEVRDSKIADALMGRIMAGTEPIEPQQICSSTSSKRPCFLVLRKSLESKSPFQISIGGSRMVVQKVLYASYNRVNPAVLNTSQVGQQCLHNDESWWCFEPSHLHHFEKDHRPAGTMRCQIPAQPDAFFISQMRPSIRVIKPDPDKTVPMTTVTPRGLSSQDALDKPHETGSWTLSSRTIRKPKGK